MTETKRFAVARTLGNVVKQIVRDEKNTPEGKTNTLVMLFAALVVVATPLVNGSSLEFSSGSGGLDFHWSFGDVLGPLICLILGMLVCVGIVAGTNYCRRRAD